jgi:hypothetical protein
MSPDLHATQLINALDQDKFSEQDKTATDAIHAQQILSQMRTELDVLDQSQSAHVPRDTPLMDMNALNVQTDKLLIQIKTRDVSHNNAKDNRSSDKEITASSARHAHKGINQTHKELSASESSQSAAALRFMTQVATSVSHAHHGKLPQTETKDVSQDNAQDSMKFSEPLTLVMHAKNAKRDPPQIT